MEKVFDDKEKEMAVETGQKRIKQGSNKMGLLALLMIVVVLLAGLSFVVLRLFEWQRPTVVLDKAVTVLGQKSKVGVLVSDQQSGLREFRIILR